MNLLTIKNLSIIALLCFNTSSVVPVQADTIAGGVSQSRTASKTKTFFQQHPTAKRAVIGAGIGTAAGAVTGLVSGKGVMRGALIGAGTGAGVGLIQSSKTLKAHPYLSKAATGTAVGAGLGLAASKGRGTGRKTFEAAGIGAAAGLGAEFLKKELK